MAGLQNVSDFSTRVYRTAAIGVNQGMNLADAWDEANDKGDKVFNPGRIDEARKKFGTTAVSIAMRIASGEDPEKIIAQLLQVNLNMFSLPIRRLELKKSKTFSKIH
jgi:hypothetical protein